MNKENQKDQSKTFYVTSPIFYPNAHLHMGHAYNIVICDILSRYHRLRREETYFLTGSDENTAKLVQAAEKAGEEPREFLEDIITNFKTLFADLDASYDQFIRTTDEERHWPGAKKLWNKLVEAGDIYKDSYKGLYCVGCEAFVTEKELVEGKCPDHDEYPKEVEEENYFFRLSKYIEKIKEKIESDEFHITPEARKHEVLSMLEGGLPDVSFSRPSAEIPWGIPVPGDDTQTIYVWCDALSNYISALGYGQDEDELYQKLWPADVHVIGKDIVKFHAIFWPAMLLSAGIALPRNILVHGFITSEGRKMSKSLGNVISPYELLDQYGVDALRYYFAREVSPFEDGDLTHERFKEAYNAHLANGIGNLVNRIMNMAEKYLHEPVEIASRDLPERYHVAFKYFEIHEALNVAWEYIQAADEYIQDKEPFKLIKTDPKEAQEIVRDLVERLCYIARMLEPFMPDTSQKIHEAVKENKKPLEPLFKRKD